MDDVSQLEESDRLFSGIEILRCGNETMGDCIVALDLRYSDGRVVGVVNAWGVRGQGTSLVLIVVITESPKT